MTRLFVVVLLVRALNAETPKIAATPAASQVRAPKLGFAVSSSPLAIRAVVGTVGAGFLDDALTLGSSIGVLAPAPGEQYALAQSGDGKQAGVMLLDEAAGLGDFQAIPGALAGFDWVRFSPNGTSAVLYGSATQRLEVLTGLPGLPQVVRDVDTSTLTGTLSAAAISDDAATLLVGLANGGSGTVAAIASDGTARTVFNAQAVSAIRFLAGGGAVIADSQANQVTLLSGDSFSPRLLAGDAQGVSAPVDIESSSNGGRVYVANSGANNVLAIDVAGGNTQALVCGFAPAGFQRLMKTAVSVIGPDTTNAWVMDTDAAAPWVALAPKIR